MIRLLNDFEFSTVRETLLSMEFKISNSKSQIPNKSQAPISNDQNG
jgi:hypothetical protein